MIEDWLANANEGISRRQFLAGMSAADYSGRMQPRTPGLTVCRGSRDTSKSRLAVCDVRVETYFADKPLSVKPNQTLMRQWLIKEIKKRTEDRVEAALYR